MSAVVVFCNGALVGAIVSLGLDISVLVTNRLTSSVKRNRPDLRQYIGNSLIEAVGMGLVSGLAATSIYSVIVFIFFVYNKLIVKT